MEQRLSPIYISVHSTNPETRRRLLRSRKERDILPILDYFRENGIVMHTQIVLCPGYNDGEDLERTIRDLAAYYPAVQSLAIVPLGMTDHREGLVALDPVTPELAERLAGAGRSAPAGASAREWGCASSTWPTSGTGCSGRAVPPEPHYDGFPQLENGIGMTRRLPQPPRAAAAGLSAARRPASAAVTVVTGRALSSRSWSRRCAAQLARTGEPVEVHGGRRARTSSSAGGDRRRTAGRRATSCAPSRGRIWGTGLHPAGDPERRRSLPG